jgi:hypothetical protein
MRIPLREGTLTSTSPADDTDRSRQLVVVVRLRLSTDWRLRHGELVDLNEVSRGRFAVWDELVPAIRALVAEEREAVRAAS